MSDKNPELSIIPKKAYNGIIRKITGKNSKKGRPMLELEVELQDNTPFEYNGGTVDVNGRTLRSWLVLDLDGPMVSDQLAAIHKLNGLDAPDMDYITENREELGDTYVGLKTKQIVSSRLEAELDEVTQEPIEGSDGEPVRRLQVNLERFI